MILRRWFKMAEELKIKLNTTSVAGTDDYNLLFNHPKINSVEVAGEKSLDDYDIKKKSEANAEHTEIHAAISSETERAEAAEKVNSDAITQEVSDRKSADSTLTDAINAETDRAQKAEKENADAIAQETESRRTGESNLTKDIEAETTRAMTAESTLTDAIAKEVTDRTTAISNHIADNSNPHNVTKAQVGLGNVDNTADANKDVKHAADSTTVNGHTVNSDVPEGAKFTDTTYSAFTGATAFSDGSAGLVPAPSTVDVNSFLCGDGTWKAVSGGTGTSDNPVKVDVILTSAVTSGTVTVYRIGHLLHIFGNNISVNSSESTIFSLQNKQIGFKIGNSASLWMSIANFTNYGAVIVGTSEILSSAVDCVLIGTNSGTGIYFSLTVPLLDN